MCLIHSPSPRVINHVIEISRAVQDFQKIRLKPQGTVPVYQILAVQSSYLCTIFYLLFIFKIGRCRLNWKENYC